MTALGTITGASPIDTSNDTYLSFTADVTETQSSALGTIPADFASMNSVNWVVEYALTNTAGDDTYDLDIRIMNGATVLAAADAGGTFVRVATNITSTADITSPSTAFAYVNTGANRATWEGASIELQQVYAKTKGADANTLKIDYAAITGDYNLAEAVRVILIT